MVGCFPDWCFPGPHTHIARSLRRLPACPPTSLSTLALHRLRRYTLRPWLAQLKGKVPELQGNLVMDQGRSLPPFPPGVEDLNSNAVGGPRACRYAVERSSGWMGAAASTDCQLRSGSRTTGYQSVPERYQGCSSGSA